MNDSTMRRMRPINTEELIDRIIKDEPDRLYQLSENPKLSNWFVGEAMKLSHGKANPLEIEYLLTKRLATYRATKRSSLFELVPEEGIDLPGPIPEDTSHGLHYDEVNFLVITYGKFGPDRQFKLNTRVRRMCESEIIQAKVRGHSADAVRKAFGVDLSKEQLIPKDYPFPPPVKPSWFRRMFRKVFQ